MLNYSKRIDPFTGEEYVEVPFKGSALAENHMYNKGMAFPQNERFSLGMYGLLPAKFSTLEVQKTRAYENFSSKTDDLEKYIYMLSLQNRNETLHYALILDHLAEMLPIVLDQIMSVLDLSGALFIARDPDTAENWRRMDPVLAILEIQAAGFELVDYSNLHYRPDDELRYEVGRKTVRGNTDRFTLLFRKPAGN